MANHEPNDHFSCRAPRNMEKAGNTLLSQALPSDTAYAVRDDSASTPGTHRSSSSFTPFTSDASVREQTRHTVQKFPARDDATAAKRKPSPGQDRRKSGQRARRPLSVMLWIGPERTSRCPRPRRLRRTWRYGPGDSVLHSFLTFAFELRLVRAPTL